MDLLEELKNLGCDIEDGLNRFMNNKALYIKMLKKFPDSVEKLEVLPFFDSGDYEQATANAHTTKGTTGSLSLTPLYKAYTQTVDLLRSSELEAARKIYEEMLPIQKKILEVIRSAE